MEVLKKKIMDTNAKLHVAFDELSNLIEDAPERIAAKHVLHPEQLRAFYKELDRVLPTYSETAWKAADQ